MNAWTFTPETETFVPNGAPKKNAAKKENEDTETKK